MASIAVKALGRVGMNTEFAGLLAAAAMLVVAIALGRQALLMGAVVLYSAVVSWIIQRDLGLLMPALGIAIGLGVMGLTKMVWREISSQDDTGCRIMKKISTSNRSIIDNIGS